MQKETKVKQIAVRFDEHSYKKISHYAAMEHRGLGEFIRHTALFYMEYMDRQKEYLNEREKKRL